MAVDKYPGSEAIDSPPDEFYDAVLSDTVDLPQGLTKCIYVEVGGNVKWVGKDQLDAAAVTRNLYKGWHPIRARRIWATGTTATGLLACY